MGGLLGATGAAEGVGGAGGAQPGAGVAAAGGAPATGGPGSAAASGAGNSAAQGAAVQTLYRDATPKQRRELGTTLATGAPSLNWRAAWTLINGRASWDANPWVWVVEFKVVTP